MKSKYFLLLLISFFFFFACSKEKEEEKTLPSLVQPDPVSLSAPVPFEWKRTTGSIGIGLSPFGLKWENYNKDPYVYYVCIEKDNAEKLVQLDSLSWETLETQEMLKSAIEEAEEISVFRGIYTEGGMKNLNYVLGVKVGEKHYLIRITRSTFSSTMWIGGGPDAKPATKTVGILGEYKE